MLLDEFLPISDFGEVHAIVIHAPSSPIFQAIKTVTVAELPLFRLLFGLRMLPTRLRAPGRSILARQQPLFDLVGRMGLILAENTDEELVFGLIGQFWRLAGGRRVQIRTAQDFLAFQQADYAKVVTNFYLQPTEHGRALRLITCSRCAPRRHRTLAYTGERPMSQDEHAEVRQREQRQAAEEAEERGRLTALRQQLYGAATRQMLEAAQLRPGDRVLDIAAGTGDQSRQAARLVGSKGRILATDISPEMLDVAVRLAQQEALTNIATRVMNAEQLDLEENSCDAVISRLGLMLIGRRQQALRGIRRVLRPGGRLAALVWSKPERNPLFALYVDILANSPEADGLEEPSSDPYSLADSVLFASALTEAGFRDVRVQAIPLTFRFPSFDVLRAWWGSDYDEALATLEGEPQQRIQEAVRQAVRQFEGSPGILAPAELLLGVAVK